MITCAMVFLDTQGFNQIDSKKMFLCMTFTYLLIYYDQSKNLLIIYIGS
jgi:hypothetical protein